ncbi:MAG: zf-HC2 domain-containing protein [Candidatus Rokubacteria bacterium]|nr:zf-HC2 domain-containing protein [Candidatus Rokubacteria bacterium]
MSISSLLRRQRPARACGGDALALSSYVDGQLAAAARARVEQHLAGCGPCRHEVEELRWLATLLADSLTPPVSSAQQRSRALARAKSRIVAIRVGREPAWTGWLRFPDRPLPVLAGALVVLVALADTLSFGGLEEIAVALAFYLQLV